MRRALLAALLALAALPTSARAQDATPIQGVQRTLDARVAAVRAGDKGAFLATVADDAPAAFKTAQARLFDGLRSLPLASYSLEARLFDTGDLSRRGEGSFLPETRQRMRLRDYDAVDAVDTLWLTFVKRGSDWRIIADDDVVDVGLDTARGLWDFGPVVAQPFPHFLILSHPEQRDRAVALGAMAERALAVHQERWTEPWPGRIPMVLPGSVEELGAILQSTIDLTKFVAFVSYSSVRDAGYEHTAPRIYIQDANLSKHSERFQTETLAHELNHAAVAYVNGPFIPAWVHEGVADWISTGQRTNERNRSSDHSNLPRDHSFSTGSQSSIVRSYSLSRAAVSTLASVKGTAAPAAFLKELGAVRVAPGSVDYQVDAALRRAAGLSIAELERLWRS